MTLNEKPIRLNAHEDRLLRHIYFEFRIPRDQYKKRPADAALLERTWENLSGRTDKWPELVRYMQNQQKAKQRLKVPWPTFEGEHKKSPHIAFTLSENETCILKEVYAEVILPLEIGTDAAAWNEEAVKLLASEFAVRTKRIVSGMRLLAVAEEMRKRKQWFLVGRRKSKDARSADFGDLDEVDGMHGS